jgi:serine/threonine-protein kinase
MKRPSFYLVLFLLFPTRAAWAQEPPADSRTAAETLFVEGRRLMAEGKAEEACRKFAESQKLDPGVGTLLNLARCYARTGKTASAWSAYREAAGQARATGQTERESAARAEADRLEPSLSRFTLTLSKEAARQSLAVSVDGQAWPSALMDVETPLDPGEHTLVAEGPGLRPSTLRFEATPARRNTLEVRALEAAVTPVTTTPAPENHPWRWTHTAAVSMVAAGLAATVSGVVWGVQASSTYDRASAYCNAAGECQPAGLELRDDAFDRAQLATVALTAGAAALVGAAVLWFSRPAPDRPPWASSAPHGSRQPLTMAVRF